MMTSKERILAALSRKQADRPPADIWMTSEVFQKLADYFGTADENEIYRTLGADKIFWLNVPYRNVMPSKPDPDEDEQFNEWGACFKPKAYAEGTYLENSFFPLKELDDPAGLDEYPWPEIRHYDFQALAAGWKPLKNEATMLSFISLFETYTHLRSFDEALMDLYIRQEFAEKALSKIAEIQLSYIDSALHAAPGIDMVYYSDDMGMQDRQLISTDVWKDFFRKHVKQIIDMVHSHGKRIFHHTDGSAFDILSEIVDLGADIINPVQYVCPGMERERLKEAFGSRVVFHGAVENQRILPFGTPDEVKKEVQECVEILGKDGGYIIAPCHNLQPNTPVENIIALYEAVKELK